MLRKERSPIATPFGIMHGYETAEGKWHKVSAQSYQAVLGSMNIGSSEKANRVTPVQLIQAGRQFVFSKPAELVLEDGTQLQITGGKSMALPVGYHNLQSLDGSRKIHLIVTPGKCFLPDTEKAWGWALQLYALRSNKSWGMGDLGDLAAFSRWSKKSLGAGFNLLNPINAVLPGSPQEASPYYPSSRIYKNPLYLSIETVAAEMRLTKIPARLLSDGHALNHERIIDRNKICRLKMGALEILWKEFLHDPDFDQFCRQEESLLESFATFCVLFEKHGVGWRRWPVKFRSPNASGIKSFQAGHRHRVEFHKWLQWLLDKQFAEAGASMALIQDLPVGFNADGFDAWMWQDLIAKNISVGAPPDSFNTAGQNWGLPPFIPHELRAANYEPFRHTVRATLRHAGGLRIDHVMGLFRLFWIPAGASPQAGAYVRYPTDELLAILAIESHRAKALIIGEDLGTVERGVRATLHRHNILSYRVLWFDRESNSISKKLSLSAVTTHDLPTVAGLWNGTDLAAQKRIGLQPNEPGTRQLIKRLSRRLKIKTDDSLDVVIQKIYRSLAKSDALLLSATLEDALAVEERPNMPGTTSQWNNWSLALPKLMHRIQRDKRVKILARILQRKKIKRPHFVKPNHST